LEFLSINSLEIARQLTIITSNEMKLVTTSDIVDYVLTGKSAVIERVSRHDKKLSLFIEHHKMNKYYIEKWTEVAFNLRGLLNLHDAWNIVNTLRALKIVGGYCLATLFPTLGHVEGLAQSSRPFIAPLFMLVDRLKELEEHLPGPTQNLINVNNKIDEFGALLWLWVRQSLIFEDVTISLAPVVAEWIQSNILAEIIVQPANKKQRTINPASYRRNIQATPLIGTPVIPTYNSWPLPRPAYAFDYQQHSNSNPYRLPVYRSPQPQLSQPRKRRIEPNLPIFDSQ